MSTNPKFFEEVGKETMMGRMGYPEELDGAAIYLLSQASSYTTAEDILIDGGEAHW